MPQRLSPPSKSAKIKARKSFPQKAKRQFENLFSHFHSPDRNRIKRKQPILTLQVFPRQALHLNKNPLKQEKTSESVDEQNPRQSIQQLHKLITPIRSSSRTSIKHSIEHYSKPFPTFPNLKHLNTSYPVQYYSFEQ